MEKIKPKIIVVGGPTACGKSDIAIALARRFNGEIISADSRQVYRGMDIGSGKVTKGEQRLAKHWLLDVASPTRQYSAAKWKKAAQKKIADIVRRGKMPIICGGTSFWIDSLVYGLALPEVKPNPALRKELATLTTGELYAKLKKLDPVRATAIDRHNPRRLVRALEIVMTTGRPVPPKVNGSPYEPLYLAITYPQDVLNRRIALRLDKRLAHGMLAEVRRLYVSGVSYKRLEAFGLEYRWLGRFFQGKVTRVHMRDGLLHDIIAYSKRQMTWLRRNKDIVWIKSGTQAATLVRKFL
jgi:tRNA dimethylallyltransferase